MEKSKKTIAQVLVCVFLLCMIWGGFFLIKKYGADRVLDIIEDDFSWVYQVDSVEAIEGNVVLSGFAFQLGVDAEFEKCEIVLHEMESGKNYFPKMRYTEYVGVNEYFLCEYDYSDSGYEATFSGRKIDLQGKNYEVLLRVKGEQRTYQTGTYLSNGEMIYTNPEEFVPIEVVGTDLERIVENGVLRVYRPDYGMYVYQYEEELYWIAEPEYDFVDGDTIIQYQIATTQIEKLPQHRLESGSYWDNIGFYFSKNELTEWNTGKYRVAKKSLPIEYSISKIWTGNSVDTWVWLQYFRPYYYFQSAETK